MKLKHLLNTKNLKLTTKCGITLVEVLISSSISIIVIMLVFNLLIHTLSIRQTAVSTTDLHKTQSYIVNDITNSVRWAKEVAIDADTINITTDDDQSILYEYQDHNFIKTNTDGSRIAMNLSTIDVDNFLMIANTSGGQTTGLSFYLALSDRHDPTHTISSINPISVRLSHITNNLSQN